MQKNRQTLTRSIFFTVFACLLQVVLVLAVQAAPASFEQAKVEAWQYVSKDPEICRGDDGTAGVGSGEASEVILSAASKFVKAAWWLGGDGRWSREKIMWTVYPALGGDIQVCRIT